MTEMKNNYMTPAMQVEEVMATQMIAESLKISTTPVDGSEALTKECGNEDAWNIWDDEEE